MREEHKKKIGLANKIALIKYFKISKGKKQAKKHSLIMKGRKQTSESNEKRRKALSGSKNYQWKGNKVGYRGLHTWVNKILGTPVKCEQCGR